jgi:hypothetical protein
MRMPHRVPGFECCAILPLRPKSVKAVELVGQIDDEHRLHAEVPAGFPAGSVRVILMLPDEDAAGSAWAAGLSSEWSAELSDPRQDIYTLDDGQPVDAAR